MIVKFFQKIHLLMNGIKMPFKCICAIFMRNESDLVRVKKQLLIHCIIRLQ